ncbi:MAG: tetratricopeptide repeat protein [Candidatus Obscuribacterales bacterium]|nr:tetratricopeptide repeat protein [Candidatus Obscuribacterales bacterium]
MIESKQQTLELLLSALAEKEGSVGADSAELCPDLEALAEAFLLQESYDQAEATFNRSLVLREKQEDHNGARAVLHRLGWVCWISGRLDPAELYFQRALQLDFIQLPQSESKIAQSAKLLTALYLEQGEYEQARSTILSISALREPASTYYQAYFLLVLAVVCRLQDDASAAKEYSEQVAPIVRDKCAIGYLVDDLALAEIVWLYYTQDRIVEAADLVFCTLLENEDSTWNCNLMAGRALARLAEFFRAQRKNKHAESVYKRGLAVFELTIGQHNAEYATLALNLSSMYLAMKKYSDAEQPLKMALKARVRVYGVEHPCVASCVETYAVLLRKTKRAALANKLESRAREIRSTCVSKLG